MLKAIIVKKTKVPTKVKRLFILPPKPTIRFVAEPINVMLETIRNVVPPFDVTRSLNHGISPSFKSEASGIMPPPLNAKFTELNRPPMTKKKSSIFATPRLNVLRISAGFTTFCVIFIP